MEHHRHALTESLLAGRVVQAWVMRCTIHMVSPADYWPFTEAGAELVDVPGAPLPPADTPAPVRFLGQWDANLLVHARRAQILPEEHRPRVFARNMPQSVPTFLVDGQVAGTWRYADGEVRCEPFHRLTGVVARKVDAEARRLATFHEESG